MHDPCLRRFRDDAMRVMLSRDGTIYFGKAQVTSADLALVFARNGSRSAILP
jgi:hypothetical protein